MIYVIEMLPKIKLTVKQTGKVGKGKGDKGNKFLYFVVHRFLFGDLYII